jgi:hypothetical protein
VVALCDRDAAGQSTLSKNWYPMQVLGLAKPVTAVRWAVVSPAFAAAWEMNRHSWPVTVTDRSSG